MDASLPVERALVLNAGDSQLAVWNPILQAGLGEITVVWDRMPWTKLYEDLGPGASHVSDSHLRQGACSKNVPKEVGWDVC